MQEELYIGLLFFFFLLRCRINAIILQFVFIVYVYMYLSLSLCVFVCVCIFVCIVQKHMLSFCSWIYNRAFNALSSFPPLYIVTLKTIVFSCGATR